jgi:hypothetical protein
VHVLTERTRLKLASGRAAAKVIDGDAIVIDTVTGRYYSLEGSGEAAWSLFVSSATLGEAAEALRARYDAADTDVLADVIRLAEQLLDENILELAPETAGAVPVRTDNGAPQEYRPPAVTVFRDMEDLLAFDPPLPQTDTTVWSAESRDA